jgi:NACalpha-BTF3-like transcription factor
VENTGCPEKEAIAALAETKGDIAEAIIKIKES